MKYCCKEFEEVYEALDIGMMYEELENAWYIMSEIDMVSSCCNYKQIYYCPFCGKSLKGQRE